MEWLEFVKKSAGVSYVDTKFNMPIEKFVVYERLKAYQSRINSVMYGHDERYKTETSYGWEHDWDGSLVPQFDFEYDSVTCKSKKVKWKQKKLAL